ncbi:MAG: T9SS type A sorting domain-containing protein, partial [Ignavibacterium sp.]
LSEWTVETFEPTPARYVKIIVLSNNQSDWANIWEVEFFGQLIISENNDDLKSIPTQFKLEQNYPNPFNPTTKICFVIPNVETTQRVVFTTLKVYDILGNEVATLVNENKAPGVYEVEFNANNLSSGVYLYRLQANDFVEVKKMILMR